METKGNAAMAAIVLGAIIIAVALLTGTSLVGNSVAGAPNATIITVVNVTNTAPVIYTVTIAPSDISLDPGNATTVNCTALVFDYNGWQDVNGSNATFYDITVGATASDDNNNHYLNASCKACTQFGGSATNASCMCQFAVQYYANNATWQCNMSVRDNGGWALPTQRINLTDTNVSSYAIINSLLAIDAPPQIDYGNLSVTQTSAEQNVSLANYGNIPFNLSIRGWGGDNETLGENYSMICGLGNISVDLERYSAQNGTAFASMIPLNFSYKNVWNFLLPQRTNDASYGADRNSTFWRIQIPSGIGGYCNGTVIVSAWTN